MTTFRPKAYHRINASRVWKSRRRIFRAERPPLEFNTIHADYNLLEIELFNNFCPALRGQFTVSPEIELCNCGAFFDSKTLLTSY